MHTGRFVQVLINLAASGGKATGRSMTGRQLLLGLFIGLETMLSGGNEVMAQQAGLAAVYSYQGARTASGELSQPTRLTAAHRTLPFGTMVRVTNRRNRRTVVVRINDRGPFTRKRIIDLTPAAAKQLGFSGLALVTVEVIHPSRLGEKSVPTGSVIPVSAP